jgi:hypothetical protein
MRTLGRSLFFDFAFPFFETTMLTSAMHTQYYKPCTP